MVCSGVLAPASFARDSAIWPNTSFSCCAMPFVVSTRLGMRSFRRCSWFSTCAHCVLIASSCPTNLLYEHPESPAVMSATRTATPTLRMTVIPMLLKGPPEGGHYERKFLPRAATAATTAASASEPAEATATAAEAAEAAAETAAAPAKAAAERPDAAAPAAPRRAAPEAPPAPRAPNHVEQDQDHDQDKKPRAAEAALVLAVVVGRWGTVQRDVATLGNPARDA